jgi:tRNA modification GTPase
VFSTSDTIVAIATPAGRGALGVVRLSGPDAHRIALDLLGRTRPLEARHATFARVVDPGDDAGSPRAVDQVVATWFAGPQSFTGDDVVEITGHGSPVLLQRVVELALQAGARLGEPGEFTLRAHLNGRLDLIQAEAIADLVDAVTPLQARVAMDQLEGTLTTAIGAVDAALFDLAARLEASLDFPDEGFHFITRDQAADELTGIATALDALIRDGRTGRLVREGATVVIAGRPNAGKSSLFNALVGTSRAIVTDVPGTTRDLVTERVDIGGLAVTLVDTAGLGEASDAIEAEGVRRARGALDVASMTLVVLDGSTPLDQLARELLRDDSRRMLPVVSKIDLPRAWPVSALPGIGGPPVQVSAQTGAGLADLRRAIVACLTAREPARDAPAMTNVRHLQLAETARACVARVRDALEAGATEELALAELGSARRALEDITGRRSAEDLLRHVFSRFCVGK